MHAAAQPSCATKAVSAEELCRAVRTSPWSARARAGGLDRVLRHDVERGVLEVQSGVPWGALVGVQGAGHFPGTVGEAVAENRPGPGGVPLVAHLAALTLATPDGQLRRATTERSPELFGLAVGGFGAFGPFYSLTIDLGSLARAAGSEAPPPTARSPATHGERHSVELLVPPESVDGVQGRLREAVAQRRFPLTCIEARRARAEHVTVLRWARRDYTLLRVEFHSRPTLGASVAAAQLHRRLLELAVEAGGSFMPGSLRFASRALAEACYPRLGEFLAEQRRMDPQGRAAASWMRDVARIWRGERCRVRFA